MTKWPKLWILSTMAALAGCVITWVYQPLGLGALFCHIWLGASISFALVERFQFDFTGIGLGNLVSKLLGFALVLIVDWVFGGPIADREPGVLVLSLVIAIPCLLYIMRRKPVARGGA